MLTRTYFVVAAVILAVAPCHADKPFVRDGATMEKAIPLRERGPKAIEEEMAWMTKLYRYTPLLATRDVTAAAIRKARATKKSVDAPEPWGHASRERKRDGRLISYWWFLTPRGRKEIYFDTGMPINTPGEVVRQESSRAQYMGQRIQLLKFQ